MSALGQKQTFKNVPAISAEMASVCAGPLRPQIHMVGHFEADVGPPVVSSQILSARSTTTGISWPSRYRCCATIADYSAIGVLIVLAIWAGATLYLRGGKL
jgi:hypothetical protein